MNRGSKDCPVFRNQYNSRGQIDRFRIGKDLSPGEQILKPNLLMRKQVAAHFSQSIPRRDRMNVSHSPEVPKAAEF